MRGLIGGLLILAGIALAGFLGGYVMLYGGIVQLVDGLSASPIDSSDVALGAIRILFADTVTFFVSVVLIVAGVAVINGDD